MKRTPVFCAEDFQIEFASMGQRISYRDCPPIECAKIANAKLDKLISEMPVVYGCSEIAADTVWNVDAIKSDTHSARLAFIEELKPKVCEHEPELASVFYHGTLPISSYYRCKKCGAKLQARWTVAE